jgi:hypothetical protein
MGDEVTTEEVQPPEKDEAVEGNESEKDDVGAKEPVVKPKRVPCKKVACEKCGRSYSVRRLDDHKCIPPTFHEEPEKTPLPPESDKPPVNVVREPTMADLTTDVISELIRRERETKRAAKRERWANHLV